MRITLTVCHDCHHAIHRFVPKNKDLGRHFNTKDKLLGHKDLACFIRWIGKQK
jgi:hypothetical protein